MKKSIREKGEIILNTTVGDIKAYFDKRFPACLKESWDNTGLLIGRIEKTVKKIIVCLDITKSVLEEAKADNADLIITHHPVIFRPLTQITTETASGRMICDIVGNDIAVYSAHTNLDAAPDGLNFMLASALGLQNAVDLNDYAEEKLFKVVIYVPRECLESVRKEMIENGAGHIGKYSECTFASEGIGTFKPEDGSNPYIGEKGRLIKVDEVRLETIVPEPELDKMLKAALSAHPYEEPAYDIYRLENGSKRGMGKVGYADGSYEMKDYISHVKKCLDIETVRFAGDFNTRVNKAAVFCGGFDGNLSGMEREKPDVLVTGDIKYNMALDMTAAGFNIIDAGHFNTEKIMIPAICEITRKKFPELKVKASARLDDVFTFC